MVNYGFIYALCGGQVCLGLLYMENANLLTGYRAYLRSVMCSIFEDKHGL